MGGFRSECTGGVANPDRVIITGHSLGAAIASVAGPWASLTWPAADVRVVTFGSPLPGNSQFAEV
jgi:predicted lipase